MVMKYKLHIDFPLEPTSTSLSIVALLDKVADFFFTNSGNISPVAVPIVEAVFILHSLGSTSSPSSSSLETSSFSGGEERKEDEQAEKDSFHSYDIVEVFLRCFGFYYILAEGRRYL